jgi:hypothetical protein
MADFLHPAARAALWRLRGFAAPLVLAAVGVWLVLAGFGFILWIGWALVGAAGVLGFLTLQRLRFGAPEGGPGIVRVVERRLAYMGPVTGGMIDLDDLERLAVVRGPAGAEWHLTGPDGQHLTVPAGALGAEVLFDAFAAIPGLSAETLIAAVNAPPDVPHILWRRAKDRLRR